MKTDGLLASSTPGPKHFSARDKQARSRSLPSYHPPRLRLRAPRATNVNRLGEWVLVQSLLRVPL